MHFSSIAEWLTTLTVGKKREKQRRGRHACFSAPIALQEFYAFDFFFFSITKGSFHCCQLNGSLYVLHPIPTHHSLSLSLSLCLSAAVSSSSFLGILPFKYSFCRSAAVFFLWLQSLKEQRVSDNSCLSLSWLKTRACDAVKLLFSWTRPITYNQTLKGNFLKPLANKLLL